MKCFLELLCVLVVVSALSIGDFYEDLDDIGIPVHSVELSDSFVIVTIIGSVSEGDSLLKHYGGVFFTVIDSIAEGWPVRELRVNIDEVALILPHESFIEAIENIISGMTDDDLAYWILEHTYLINLP